MSTGPASGPVPVPGGSGADELRKGTAYGLVAYLLWGAFPIYFHALIPATALEILAQRILWTLVVCAVALLVRRDLSWLRGMLRDRRLLVGLSVAAVFLAVNWVTYVAAVVSDHVTEASLGYFLNPLVTVALGVLVLRERLRPLQWVAVGVGLAAGLYLAVVGGTFPWISLILATSFAVYGLIKKRIGADLPALHGLTVETVVLTPFAVVVVVWLGVTGRATFGDAAPWHPVLLALGGAITAVPLLLFAAAARRVPLVTIGLLQFVTPVLQLLVGVLLLHEEMSSERWIGFGIVWIALMMLTIDSLVARPRRARGTGLDDPEPAPG